MSFGVHIVGVARNKRMCSEKCIMLVCARAGWAGRRECGRQIHLFGKSSRGDADSKSDMKSKCESQMRK